MGQLLIQEKSIVVPGDILAEGMDFLPAQGTYREKDKIVAMQLGMVEVNGRLIRIIPLASNYMPMPDDIVIGRISDLTYSSWFVNIGYAFDAVLNVRDATTEFVERGAELSEFFNIGDFIVTRITNVTKSKMVDLTMKGPGLRKLTGGRIININPAKVPRVVGKKGSMVAMIKEATNCHIIVGQNGRVWISGKNPADEWLAAEAIAMIDKYAHISGLTEKVKGFLEQNKKRS